MAEHLKRGIGEAESKAADAKVRETVEAILADIEARGADAVRALSVKFDGWSPESFRLSTEEIDRLVASVPDETIADITFAQAQIRKFAEVQRAALTDDDVGRPEHRVSKMGHRIVGQQGKRGTAQGFRPAEAGAFSDGGEHSGRQFDRGVRRDRPVGHQQRPCSGIEKGLGQTREAFRAVVSQDVV